MRLNRREIILSDHNQSVGLYLVNILLIHRLTWLKFTEVRWWEPKTLNPSVIFTRRRRRRQQLKNNRRCVRSAERYSISRERLEHTSERSTTRPKLSTATSATRYSITKTSCWDTKWRYIWSWGRSSAGIANTRALLGPPSIGTAKPVTENGATSTTSWRSTTKSVGCERSKPAFLPREKSQRKNHITSECNSGKELDTQGLQINLNNLSSQRFIFRKKKFIFFTGKKYTEFFFPKK